jgi:hypothetical protein
MCAEPSKSSWASLRFSVTVVCLSLVTCVVPETSPRSVSAFVFEDAGACPFECCTYREWTTHKPTTVHSDRSLKSPVNFRLKPGEPVTGLTGVVVTRKPGRTVIDRPVTLECGSEKVEAKPHEVLSLLHYEGEGYFKFKFRGAICVGEIPFPVKREKKFGVLGDAREIRTYLHTETVPETIWWVQVKNSDGKVGWTNEPAHFEHMDACE